MNIQAGEIKEVDITLREITPVLRKLPPSLRRMYFISDPKLLTTSSVRSKKANI